MIAQPTVLIPDEEELEGVATRAIASAVVRLLVTVTLL
jgi:hypothetical protein